tara:strand:+ start:1420 stop:1602 length:183 start_codon:yes stop_codon:yes gene_type:complete
MFNPVKKSKTKGIIWKIITFALMKRFFSPNSYPKQTDFHKNDVYIYNLINQTKILRILGI